MLGAVIRNGNNTLVVDLPTGTMDLQTKLNSIGIQETSDKIKLSDEDGNPIRVKLYATTAEEVHLLPLLAPNRTLADQMSPVCWVLHIPIRCAGTVLSVFAFRLERVTDFF